MIKNKSSLVGIIALIIGASGLGLGVYSIINIQGLQGPPGQDAPEGYICSSEQEINDVLDAIGTGTVIITTINTIILHSPIILNKGGNYTFKGVNSIFVCESDTTAFEITNVSSCYLYDLKVDASAITSNDKHIIHINDVNDNSVHIENVLIFGDSDKKGYGIYMQSDNILIRNCIFNLLNRGIHLYFSSHTNIYNSDFCNNTWGIYKSGGDYNVIRGNYIEYTGGGIYITGDHNIVSNNEIIHVTYIAIENNEGYYTSITENFLDGSSLGASNTGIYVSGSSFDYSIMIYRNVICNWDYGIVVDTVEWASIVNNTFINSALFHIIWTGLQIIITGNVYFLPNSLFP